MGDLLAKARAIASARNNEYPEWRETAARFDESDPAEYPRVMIRAKLARDPECRREDTRVDLVNYLAMLDEESEPEHPVFKSHPERMADLLERGKGAVDPGMGMLGD